MVTVIPAVDVHLCDTPTGVAVPPVVSRSTALVADLERAAERVAAKAPPLSDATLVRLREILGGVL